MMNSMVSLLPALLCVGVMFGGGAFAWLLARTPLRRARSQQRDEKAGRWTDDLSGQLAHHA
jgi:hypothetical protein